MNPRSIPLEVSQHNTYGEDVCGCWDGLEDISGKFLSTTSHNFCLLQGLWLCRGGGISITALRTFSLWLVQFSSKDWNTDERVAWLIRRSTYEQLTYCHGFSALFVVFPPACSINSPVIPDPVSHTRSSLLPFSPTAHSLIIPSLLRSPHLHGPSARL